jgi:4a-hydroxytetrahydrobiopterin dehydratase
MALTKLDEAALAEALKALPEWRRVGDQIEREFRAETFRAAVQLVNRIADLAEGANHHPDLKLSYTKLHIALSTHDAGGLTRRDVNLARVIDDVLLDA